MSDTQFKPTLSAFSRALVAVSVLTTLLVFNRLSMISSKDIRANNLIVHRAEVVYVPENRIISLLSLGYHQVAADMLWLRTLSYFSRHFRTNRKYRWLEHFLDQIIHFDPKFHLVYHWAGANVLYGGRFTKSDVLLSNRFYKQALEIFPDDFEAAYRLGLNYYVEMKSDDPEERLRQKQIGLSYLEMSANMPGSTDLIRSLVAGVSNRLGQSQLAVQYLIDVYLRTEDEKEREDLKRRISELQQSGAGATDMANAAEQFNHHWRDQFPYLPPAIYGLMDEPTRPNQTDVDWHTLLPDVNTHGAAGESL